MSFRLLLMEVCYLVEPAFGTNKSCVGVRIDGTYGRPMRSSRITTIVVDADDTLWHNERYFNETERRFVAALAPYATESELREALLVRGVANLDVYGYGARSFTLSMIETALSLGGDAMPASVIGEVLEAGRDLLRHPVELFPGVGTALEVLATRADLILLTKGDLLHQEAKVAASGVAELFTAIEIVSDKSPAVLERILGKYAAEPSRVMVVGDSLRSDVLPALSVGAWAAHIPHPLAWSHEQAVLPETGGRFRQLAELGQLAGWLEEID